MNKYDIVLCILVVIISVIGLVIGIGDAVAEYRWCQDMMQTQGIHAVWTFTDGCKLVGNPLDQFEQDIQDYLEEGNG